MPLPWAPEKIPAARKIPGPPIRPMRGVLPPLGPRCREIHGTATRYETPALANAVAVSTGHPYKTRILVRRPADPEKFNGEETIRRAQSSNVGTGRAASIR